MDDGSKLHIVPHCIGIILGKLVALIFDLNILFLRSVTELEQSKACKLLLKMVEVKYGWICMRLCKGKTLPVC